MALQYIFKERVSQWPLGLYYLVSKPPVPTYLSAPALGLQECTIRPSYLYVGAENRNSDPPDVCTRLFTYQIISIAPTVSNPKTTAVPVWTDELVHAFMSYIVSISGNNAGF